VRTDTLPRTITHVHAYLYHSAWVCVCVRAYACELVLYLPIFYHCISPPPSSFSPSPSLNKQFQNKSIFRQLSVLFDFKTKLYQLKSVSMKADRKVIDLQKNQRIARAKKLTKRLELSFLNVFALPNASSIGLVWRISFSIPLPPPRAAKYCIVIFAVSVFPAPLSPLEKHKCWVIFPMLKICYKVWYRFSSYEASASSTDKNTYGNCLSEKLSIVFRSSLLNMMGTYYTITMQGKYLS